MSDYIVTRTVPGLQMMRVNKDNRQAASAARAINRVTFGDHWVPTHRPKTLRARLWRWVLGG